MKNQFTKDVMKLAFENKVINENDSFVFDSVKKLHLETKIPIKVSGIMRSIICKVFTQKNLLEMNND